MPIRGAIDSIAWFGIKRSLLPISGFVAHALSQDITLQMQIKALASSADYVEQHLLDVPSFRDRFVLLDHALKMVEDKKGLYCEFGVFKGATINRMADRVKEQTIHGFDSFEGLPGRWRAGHDTGSFSLQGKLPPVRKNVKLYPGWFDHTLPAFIKENPGPVAFLHVDCDMYSSTKTIFELLRDRISSGTVILFDEYFNYPQWQQHEYKAFQEFVAEQNLKYRYINYNERGNQVGVKIL